MTLMGKSLDLDPETRRALEFDELLEWVASYARTAMGARRVVASIPSSDAAVVRREIGSVEEVRRMLAEEGKLLPGRLPDPTTALDALGIVGMRLEAGTLLDLAVVLRAAADLRRRLSAPPAERRPNLAEIGRSMPDLMSACRPVLEGVDGEGKILDGASAELRRIRSAAARVGDTVRRMLERTLRDPRAQAVIQDDFVTQRNGRFVIPVRTDAPRAVSGIVHASSSSGATRFVEPLETVELNNDLVRLAEEESAEQDRLVASWSDSFRAVLPEVEAGVRGLARVDELQARGLFAEASGGTAPNVVAGGPIRLESVRHPLLDRRMREEGTGSVPASFRLDPADRVMLLSGPNTGGKTVALKTIGLAVLMAQAGIPVSAASLDLPVYRQVRADIGDHQSIQADLSTYSAHIGAVIRFLASPDPPALFLFDEIGTGTEPAEGAALSQAILESLLRPSLLRPGITAVATTHLAALKAWAFQCEGASCAALEFDEVSLRPTYRIVMGAAGVSAGLEIAARLGVEPGIVGRARELLDPRAREGEGYLRQLRDALGEAEASRDRLVEKERLLADERAEVAERAQRESADRRQAADLALRELIRELRGLGRKEVAAINDSRERARAERKWSRAEAGLRREAARRAEEVIPGGLDPVAVREPVERPEPGMRVWVRSLAREGDVKQVRGKHVDVQMGEVVFGVAAADLMTAVTPSGEAVRPTGVTRRMHEEPPRPDCPRELMLIGRRVDEALEEVERYLDAASRAGHDEVRIVHGHGTGRLRSAVRKFLDEHVLVDSHRSGRGNEGGDGATVAKLA